MRLKHKISAFVATLSLFVIPRRRAHSGACSDNGLFGQQCDVALHCRYSDGLFGRK